MRLQFERRIHSNPLRQLIELKLIPFARRCVMQSSVVHWRPIELKPGPIAALQSDAFQSNAHYLNVMPLSVMPSNRMRSD